MKKNNTFKILTLKKLHENYLKDEKNKDVFQRLKYLDTSLRADDLMFCIFDDKKLVAVLGLEKKKENIFINQYVCVDPEYRQQGFATYLLEQQIIYVKKNDGVFINSRYSPEGKKYIKKYIDLYGQYYNVIINEFDEKEIRKFQSESVIECTLVISPPGGGKTTWIKNHEENFSLILDDISLNKNALHEIEECVSKNESFVIGDINLCDYEILKRSWQTLFKIGNKYKKEISIHHVVLTGDKQTYLNNIKYRDDGRNVLASFERFYPRVLELKEKNFISDVEFLSVHWACDKSLSIHKKT